MRKVIQDQGQIYCIIFSLLTYINVSFILRTSVLFVAQKYPIMAVHRCKIVLFIICDFDLFVLVLYMIVNYLHT